MGLKLRLPLACLVLIFAAVSGNRARRDFGTEDIYFAGFFPMNDRIGEGVLPAVKLAIKHINNSTKVLPGKTMHMLFNNTEVSLNSDVRCAV